MRIVYVGCMDRRAPPPEGRRKGTVFAMRAVVMRCKGGVLAGEPQGKGPVFAAKALTTQIMGSDSQASWTKEMMHACRTYLHLISLVGHGRWLTSCCRSTAIAPSIDATAAACAPPSTGAVCVPPPPPLPASVPAVWPHTPIQHASSNKNTEADVRILSSGERAHLS